MKRQSLEALRWLAPNRLLYGLGRLHRALEPSVRLSYSQEGEDLLLERILGLARSGFFVDVGAHHPSRFSNTRFFYERGWRGINIEPAPEAIAAFQRERTRDINLQVGVAEKPGTLTYYRFDDSALNTFDEALKRDREANTQYRVVGTLSVPVERLETILERSLPKGQSIDFLSVDVEGFDLQVLRSNNWRVFRPRFVLVEALDFKLELASGHPVHSQMGGVGYELVAKTLNTLFYRDGR